MRPIGFDRAVLGAIVLAAAAIYGYVLLLVVVILAQGGGLIGNILGAVVCLLGVLVALRAAGALGILRW